ncbi:mRNA-decapping enzyme subunit 2, partial [Kappamyces sp. JEL0680]
MTVFKNVALPEVLEDLTRYARPIGLRPGLKVVRPHQSRFIINIPEEELSSIERVIFQIELAHWFYEDFIREENPKLPSCSLKHFSLLLFQSCILLRHWVAEHERAFATFMEYKVKVPVCGAIILNTDMTKVLLVRGFAARAADGRWKSNATWGFPKGKINQGEAETSCCIREVFEECGFDVSPYLRENEYLERKIYEQRNRLYMISGIDESVQFSTQTRKEIG